MNIDAAREASDARLIEQHHGDDPDQRDLAVIERAENAAAAMNCYALMDYVDDLEAILSRMPEMARAAYYRAHRDLVVEAMVKS